MDNIVEKTPDLNELHVDGGYGSQDVDSKMEEYEITLVTTAVRGREIKIEKSIIQNPENTGGTAKVTPECRSHNK